MDDDRPVGVAAAPGLRLARRMPTSVSVACGVLWFGVVSACIPAAIVLMAAVQGIPGNLSGLRLLPVALVMFGLVLLLAFTATRLSRGSRRWWFAALGVLGVEAVVSVVGTVRSYERPTQFLIPALVLLGLTCLLTPSARRFVRPLPPA